MEGYATKRRSELKSASSGFRTRDLIIQSRERSERLPMSWTIHGPKDVRAIEIRLSLGGQWKPEYVLNLFCPHLSKGQFFYDMALLICL